MTLTLSLPKTISYVIPANAGGASSTDECLFIHLDLAFDSGFSLTRLESIREGKIKMDPSVRWDDDILGERAVLSGPRRLAARGQFNDDSRLTSTSTTEDGAA